MALVKDELSLVSDGHSPRPAPSRDSLQSRAYQMEMFELSLKENIIVCMDTGSGKTQIARLRIEAELERSSAKLIWLLAPSQVLATQQHVFLASQLPAYTFRLITGADHAEYWLSKDVWDAALLNQNGVVSTPQILLDALNKDYVRLSRISLLIFDEAHHCSGDHPYGRIMTSRYWPSRRSEIDEVPCILGLTASPMLRDDLDQISQLERNMDAVCRSPTLNLEQYQTFTSMSELVWLPFTNAISNNAWFLPRVERLVRSYDVETDPEVIKLRKAGSPKAEEKLHKYLKKGPPVLQEIQDLLKKAEFMDEALGSWATDRYVLACVEQLCQAVQQKQDCLLGVEQDGQTVLAEQLSPLREEFLLQEQQPLSYQTVSNQVSQLVEYLKRECQGGMTCVIFVQRRSSAYALCDVLNHSDSLAHHGCFTFVGSSNLLRRNLTDLADFRRQEKAFADFRLGKRNICICTNVLEEGIDVQACNLVVCFDLPQTNKSYIQRRGRGRHRSSKFVLMHPAGAPPTKLQRWKHLEQKMREHYSDQDRERQELVSLESAADGADHDPALCHGHAKVEEADARSLLEYFCNTMKRYGEPPPSPVYILDRSAPDAISCTVALPADLPANVRTAHSTHPRTKELAAKRDAAFQAYKQLHSAGLLNDHLMPIHAEARKRRGARYPKIETRNSMVEVDSPRRFWELSRDARAGNAPLYGSRIHIPGLPTMLLLLAEPLPAKSSCDIHPIDEPVFTAHVTPIPQSFEVEHETAVAVTKFLFRAVLSRRLPGIEDEKYHVPYYLLPDQESDNLPEWLEASRRSSSVRCFTFDPAEEEFVVNKRSENIPYLYRPSHRELSTTFEEDIEAVRLTRAIDFTSTASGSRQTPIHKKLPRSECTVSSLRVGYVKAMAYIPTIMHTVEIAMRVQQAQRGPLQSICFSDLALLTAALTAPGAGNPSYQRLEFLGDVILKFMATVSVFCSHPNHSEGALSIALDQVINNARLHRSTLDLKLDAVLSIEPFSSKAWTLAAPPSDKSKRQISTKTLADVVEALLGVAYLEERGTGFGKVVKALELFIPEIGWNNPSDHISMLEIADLSLDTNNERFSNVQEMLGYRFKKIALLAEALNHSSPSLTQIRSYDRLEFLGDAILDLLVKKPLYDSPHHFSEQYMTLARHALVNKETFAFLTTLARSEVMEKGVDVSELRKPKVTLQEKRRVRHLHDYMFRAPCLELATQRADLLKHYGEVEAKVLQALESGKVWPWADLMRLASPKWASDVLESLVGAVFIDSGADLDQCEEVLRNLGLMTIVQRVAAEGNIEFRQARVRAKETWNGVRFECVRYQNDDEGGQVVPDMQGQLSGEGEDEPEDDLSHTDWLWRCQVLLNGSVLGEFEGATCTTEAKERAAEAALMKAAAASAGNFMLGKEEKTRKRERLDDEEEEDDQGAEHVGYRRARDEHSANGEVEVDGDIVMSQH